MIQSAKESAEREKQENNNYCKAYADIICKNAKNNEKYYIKFKFASDNEARVIGFSILFLPLALLAFLLIYNKRRSLYE